MHKNTTTSTPIYPCRRNPQKITPKRRMISSSASAFRFCRLTTKGRYHADDSSRRSFTSLINAWNEYPSLAKHEHDHADGQPSDVPDGPSLLKTYSDINYGGSTTTTTSPGGGILTLTLNRPHQRNALNYELLTDLHKELTDIATNNSNSNTNPSVVVIQSQGPVFSSGHDLKELLKITTTNGGGGVEEDNNTNPTSNTTTPTTTRELFELCSDTMLLLQSLSQPTICAVQGLATAAGLQLVCSCDIVLASPRAAFQTPGVNLGLFCHTPAVPLMKTVGRKVATDMLLTGRALTSQEGLQYGIVSRVVGNPQKEATKLAHQMAEQSSTAVVQMGKRILLAQLDGGGRGGEASSSSSSSWMTMKDSYDIATTAMVENMEMQDAIHGIESFLKKETPKWRNE